MAKWSEMMVMGGSADAPKMSEYPDDNPKTAFEEIYKFIQ